MPRSSLPACILVILMMTPGLPARAGAVVPHKPASRGGPSTRPPAIETSVQEFTNLVHWVDNLAGSSIGKTAPLYRRYWQERFGGFTAADQEALKAFATIRLLSVPREGGIANEAGCLPQDDASLRWSQFFMSEAMRATTMKGFLAGLSAQLDAGQLESLRLALSRFQPRFAKAWSEMGHVHRFEKRFRRFMAESKMPALLADMSRFFGVAGAPLPPMSISFIALPYDGPTHAEADGDRLLIEIRPGDVPELQIPVVAHEAAHFMMRHMTSEQTDALARQAFSVGDAGVLAWRFMLESLPTALGQGYARARVDPRRFSAQDSWYHYTHIDRFAKRIYPVVSEAMNRGDSIHGGLMSRLAALMSRSIVYRQTGPAGYLIPAFYASGEGLEPAMNVMKHRLGLGYDTASPGFVLSDAAGDDWLRRYACLSGLALVSPAEIERAARLGDERLLDEADVERVRAYIDEGRAGVIAAGRRRAGGVVFFLVVGNTNALSDLVGRFIRLRGIPDAPLPFGPGPPETGRPAGLGRTMPE